MLAGLHPRRQRKSGCRRPATSAPFILSWLIHFSLRNHVCILPDIRSSSSIFSTADVSTASFHRLLFKDYCTVHQLNEALLMVSNIIFRNAYYLGITSQAMKLLDNKLSRSVVEIRTHKQGMTCDERAVYRGQTNATAGCSRWL